MGTRQSLALDVADRAVANLLADGYSAPEIGRQLGMTAEAVKGRIKLMRAPRGATTTPHLIALLFRSGDLT